VRVGFRLLDVFCLGPFTGNQLCVVPDAAGLQTPTLQALAREIGFSETTFVTAAEGDRYDVRIFTPGQELPFAGHPTLGTAFALASEGRVSSTVTQSCGAGEVLVEVDVPEGRGRMLQLAAELGPALAERALVARAAGLAEGDLHPDRPVMTVSTGLPHTIVPVRDAATLRRAERNGSLVGEAVRATGGESLYLFAESGEGEVEARMFDWELGVGEDPATGSAAGPLGVYLAELGLAGMPGDVRVRQGERVGRPSLLEVRVERHGRAWRAWVGGAVRIVGEGEFHLQEAPGPGAA
jgi:trans-2,3-dihydro-3-hydroxyanthranilate isomerase